MASRSLSASRRGGVRSIVVDQKRELDTHSRAIALFPRTLEIFRSLGVVEDLIVSGEQSSHLRLRRASDRKTLIDFDFGTYYPITQCNYLLAIPQNRTERVLFEHAQRNDRIELRMGCSFVRFEDDEAGGCVHVRLREGEGVESVVEARFLVGADGSHSSVRQQLGWELQGKTYATRAVLADVEVSEEADTADGWLAEPDRPSLLMSIRYAPRIWRLIEQGIPDTLTDAELADHARELTEVLFGEGAWRKTVWTSAYRKHERVAPHFRSGRVLLAGDAAHLNSPAGGQGLNTGIRDWTCFSLVESGVVGDAPFELGGAGEAERRVTASGIVEAIDVTGQRVDGLGSRLEGGAPDQFALQRLEERLDHRVVKAIPLARHRNHDAMSS